MEVSFIVPALNSAGTIRETLASIKAQKTHLSFEIIVVDNGSTDDTSAIAEDAGCKVIKCTRKGPGAARNDGVKVSTGQWVAFIDSDVILSPDWLEELLVPMKEKHFLIGLGKVVPFGSEDFLFQYRKALGNLRYQGTSISVHGPNGIVTPVVNTAACIYEKALFLAVGGFDERYHRLEDTDLSRRAFGYGGAMIFATSKAVAQVQNDRGVQGYLKRSFVLGRAKAQFYSFLPGTPLSNFLEEARLFKHSSLSPEHRIFFLVNLGLNMSGIITEMISPRKVTKLVPHRALSRMTRERFSFHIGGETFVPGPTYSVIQVDSLIHFVRFGDVPDRVSVREEDLRQRLPELVEKKVLGKV